MRRAMSKKKGEGDGSRSGRTLSTETRKKVYRAVLQMESDEKTANKIYDEMIDFAKYAFNKSHAAAYAVGILSDSLVEILLSGRVYGGADDVRDR